MICVGGIGAMCKKGEKGNLVTSAARLGTDHWNTRDQVAYRGCTSKLVYFASIKYIGLTYSFKSVPIEVM